MTSTLDTIINQSFSYIKNIAKQWYHDWMKTPPHCPAFHGEVIHVSRYGWEHLVRLRKRTKFELLGRLFVLERARELLETATHFQKHEIRGDEEFWIFEAEIDGILIKVVVRSIKQGNKHFYSVIRKGSVEKEIGN